VLFQEFKNNLNILIGYRNVFQFSGRLALADTVTRPSKCSGVPLPRCGMGL